MHYSSYNLTPNYTLVSIGPKLRRNSPWRGMRPANLELGMGRRGESETRLGKLDVRHAGPP